MKWTVTERRSLNKQIRKLPEKVQNMLVALKKDMELNGPIRGDWPNFSALSDDCHLKKVILRTWRSGKSETKRLDSLR